MDFIPLSHNEQKVLKKIYKSCEIEIKSLNDKEQAALKSLARSGLVSDKIRSIPQNEQKQQEVKPGEIFFINENGKRHFINLKQQRFRFYLPIVISVLALLISLGTMLVNLLTQINPCG